jgi:hypothetical protein
MRHVVRQKNVSAPIRGMLALECLGNSWESRLIPNVNECPFMTDTIEKVENSAIPKISRRAG